MLVRTVLNCGQIILSVNVKINFTSNLCRNFIRQSSSSFNSGNGQVIDNHQAKIEERNEQIKNKHENDDIIFSEKSTTTMSLMDKFKAVNNDAHLPMAEEDEVQKRMKQTSEYFSQYIEEYYEEEEEATEDEIREEDGTPELLAEPIIKVDVSEITMEEIVSLLKEHRAQNILSINILSERCPWNSIIICSPYNDRHGQALTQTIRKHIKTLYHFEDDQLPRQSKITNGWFVFDMKNVILHIMSEFARKKYDLEALYSDDQTINEIDDDMIPPPASPSSTASSVSPAQSNVV